MVTRILLTILILALNYFNSFSQTKEEKLDRMTISYTGDSLLSQKYELIIKSKKIYSITPVLNYLHVKGGKYKRPVEFNKGKRENIFSMVDQLTWTSLGKTKGLVTGDRYYVIEIFNTDKLISTYKVSEELLPSDFKTLYNIISDGK
ncbi:hypothetical protein WSM22_31380 [Cytophagales bacterium WSM2-2]|nr:hypothetical protein WSM22_31380 [Cytophagales bacterium WSM2-2]